jgi:hypothetical protein
VVLKNDRGRWYSISYVVFTFFIDKKIGKNTALITQFNFKKFRLKVWLIT